mmetsp:Transcript_88069/g.273604  ORF Transcript_88069/g.273604 Transcript_88069/m.273604 type:complete len:227 (-) Transcript_88069:766-1446(-)
MITAVRMAPFMAELCHIQAVMMGSSFGLGRILRMDLSPGSMPSAMEGGRSVTRMRNRICSGVLMTGMFAMTQTKICSTSAMWTDMMKATNFWMPAYMTRPFSTAATMEQKLSSVKTMSDAPLATSVPWMPIATPMSAWFSAGASLTPSPVMAVTYPCRCSDCTISNLSSGFARAKTRTLLVNSSMSPSEMYCPSGRKRTQSTAACSVSSFCCRMLTLRAIASAVFT